MEDPCAASVEMIEEALSMYGKAMMTLGRLQMEECLEVDLTMPQLKVLMVLWHGGSASVGVLAGALGVSLPTMTGILDRLVEHGLVERQGCPEDRRLVLNRLTDSGTAIIVRFRQASRQRFERVLRRLAAPELTLVINALEKLCRAAEDEHEVEVVRRGTHGAGGDSVRPSKAEISNDKGSSSVSDDVTGDGR